MEQTVHVELKQNSYDITIKNGLLSELGNRVRKLYTGSRIFVLTDRYVSGLYGRRLKQTLESAGFTLCFFSLEPGEPSKDLKHLQQVYEKMLDFGMQREDLLLTLGGGVVGDLGGFAAATYLRGIPFMQVPTTLMAQADSSVGGKVAVNLSRGKNLVGSFYQPKAVWIDPELLQTLPEEVFADGFAEVVKYGCILDKELFEILEKIDRTAFSEHSEDILKRCCSWKSSLVGQDPDDKGIRMLLNFGHTIGHGIEAASGYTWSHGEAVAVGMARITRMGERRGITKEGTAARIETLMKKFSLQTDLPELPPGELEKALLHDKKNRHDRLTVILLTEIGASILYETELTFFNEVLYE